MDLSDWVERRAAFAPDRAALYYEGEAISYGGLAARVARLAAVLQHRLGVEGGDRVAVLGLNNPDTLALLFACARLGAIMVPLNWRLAPREHLLTLEDTRPRALFVEPEFIADVPPDTAGIARVVLADAPLAGHAALADLLADDPPPARPAPGIDYAAPVMICCTSGATGQPKGVVLDQNSVLFNAVHSAHMHDLTSADHVLTCLPLFHVGGMNIQTLPALHAGAAVTLHRKFDAGAVIDAIEREGVTLTVLVPTQIKAVLEHPRWPEADLSGLRMITTGSTVVPTALIEAVLARGVPLIQVYGSTETSPIAAYNDWRRCREEAGTSGKTAMHCAIRIVGNDGHDLPPGEDGEILVKGPNVMRGYWDKPELTADCLRDGWFATGDIGHFDADGSLCVSDRKKDMIISGGENIYPAEIEAVLAGHPDIVECAVVGLADDRWGEVPVVAVVPREGAALAAEDVVGFLDGRLARYKFPRGVVFAEALPRNAMGKLQKAALRRAVETGSLGPVIAARPKNAKVEAQP